MNRILPTVWCKILALLVLVLLMAVGFLVGYCFFRTASLHPTAMAISPDGKLMAVGYSSGQIRTWVLPEYRNDWKSNGPNQHHSAITSLSFSPNSRRLVSASESGLVVLWPISERYNKSWNAWKVVNLRNPTYASYLPNGEVGLRTNGQYQVATLREVYLPNVGWILRTRIRIIKE